jgi:hypothetical protein
MLPITMPANAIATKVLGKYAFTLMGMPSLIHGLALCSRLKRPGPLQLGRLTKLGKMAENRIPLNNILTLRA